MLLENATMLPQPCAPGDSVDVTYEEEVAGQWVARVGRGRVARLDGDYVVVDWMNGGLDPVYRCHRRYVLRVAGGTNATASPPLALLKTTTLCAGDSVLVTFEEEGADGEWRVVDEPAVVVEVLPPAGGSVAADNARVVVDWGDGDAHYTTEKRYVSLLPVARGSPAAATNAPARGEGVSPGSPAQPASPYRPGERVLVTYEQEDDTTPGLWHAVTSSAKCDAVLPDGRVRVTWLGTGESYTCPAADVDVANGLPLCYSVGDLVSVDFEMESDTRPGEWVRATADAFVVRIHPNRQVEVAWLDSAETYVTCPSHLSFTSERKTVDLSEGYAFPPRIAGVGCRKHGGRRGYAGPAPPTPTGVCAVFPPASEGPSPTKVVNSSQNTAPLMQEPRVTETPAAGGGGQPAGAGTPLAPGDRVVVFYDVPGTLGGRTEASATAAVKNVCPDGRVEVVWLEQTPFPSNQAYIAERARVSIPVESGSEDSEDLMPPSPTMYNSMLSMYY